MTILKVYIKIALAVLTALFYILPSTESKGIIGFCFITVLIAGIYLIKYEKSILKWHSWITPSVLLLISLVIVYYQWIIDFLVGLRPISSFVNPSLLNHYVVISSVGVLAFIDGYSSRIKNISRLHKISEKSSGGMGILVILQVGLFGLFVLNINVSDFITGNDYSGTHSLGLFTYLEYFLQAVNIAILVSVINNTQTEERSLRAFLKSIPILSIVVLSLYLVLRLFSGDRGPVISTVLAVFFSYLYYSRKHLKLIFLVAIVLIGAYGVSLVGMARNYDTTQSFSQRVSDAAVVFNQSGRFDDYKSVSPLTQELAFSHLSYEVMVGGMVQDNDGYRYGMYQLVALGNTIPFFNGILHSTLGLTRDQTSSSYYATYKYIGQNPSWGLGTNCIGDFFMDFGILGVLLGMFLVGLAFKYIDQILFDFDKGSVSYSMLAFAIVYASKSIYIARSNFLAEFKVFVFVLVILWISRLFSIRPETFDKTKTNRQKISK